MTKTAAPSDVSDFEERLGMLSEPLALKARDLRTVLEDLARPAGCFALAYSGGLDSRFLAFFASNLRIPVRLLHVTGPHVPETESRAALEAARAMGFERVGNRGEPPSAFDRTIELLRLDPLANDAIFTAVATSASRSSFGRFATVRRPGLLRTARTLRTSDSTARDFVRSPNSASGRRSRKRAWQRTKFALSVGHSALRTPNRPPGPVF